MTINTFSADELELLAAGYVLDDLDEAEMTQVEELIQSSPAMREQIRQSLAVMGILATDAQPMSPPVGLKAKIKQAFAEEKDGSQIISQSENIPARSGVNTVINLENWLQKIFEAGWQVATELLDSPSLTSVFRDSTVEGGRLISVGADNTQIVLIVRVTPTSPSHRDVVVEISPKLKQAYLPSGLELMLLDTDGDPVMEATTRQDNTNLKFDFTGTYGEAFSIKLKLFNNYFQEDFIL